MSEAVCIAHGRFAPCWSGGEHRITANPYWVKSVQDYLGSAIPGLTWEPAWEHLERYTLVDETVTVDGVTYTADRVREIVRERHVLATELALCREQSATLRQQLDGACRAIVNAQVH